MWFQYPSQYPSYKMRDPDGATAFNTPRLSLNLTSLCSCGLLTICMLMMVAEYLHKKMASSALWPAFSSKCTSLVKCLLLSYAQIYTKSQRVTSGCIRPHKVEMNMRGPHIPFYVQQKWHTTPLIAFHGPNGVSRGRLRHHWETGDSRKGPWAKRDKHDHETEVDKGY